MSDRFRLTIAQLNPTVGDLHGNAQKARQAWEVARDAGADMIALPDGSKVSVADLKAAWAGSGESAEGEGMENAEPPADTPAAQPVEVSRQKANAAPAKPAPRVVNPALKNAAAKAGDTIDPRGEVDTEQARLARGKARYSRAVDQGGK